MFRIGTFTGVVVLACATMTGCASNTSAQATSDCLTVACLHEQVKVDLAKRCNHELFWYKHRSTQRQAAIRAEYQYPLTSADDYFALARRGSVTPSPQTWCRAYAEVRVATQRAALSP